MRDLILGADAPGGRARYSRTMRRLLSVFLEHNDLAMAMALLALGLVEALIMTDPAPLWPQVALTFVWTIPLVWRRRWPIAVLALVIAMGPVLDLINTQGGVTSFVLSAILAAYTVGRELDEPATWWGPALTVGFGWVVYGATGGALSDFVFVAVLYGGAWAVGYTIRRRDLAVDELTRATDALRRTQAEQERLAVEVERARIARELHDIAAHNISVITIQAQVVRRRLGPDSGEAEDLRAIETTARQTMVEMRHLLGVLRAKTDAPALAPQPGLRDLPLLVAEVRAAGVDVSLSVEGEPFPAPPGLGLACYRVVQEALTNVRKHSLAGSADVLLRYRPDALEIRVDDHGPTRSGGSHDDALVSGGHGLAGMRERITLYGGEVRAGPLASGGFRVHAILPLGSAGELGA